MQQKIIKRTDYTPPHFSVDKINLTFDLNAEKTIVTNHMQLTALQDNKALKLDGEHLKLISIKLNDNELGTKDYDLTEHELTIKQTPKQFSLTIVTEISPIKNTALEGLFISNDIFCTQCEAHGFRHMTYYLDRPDVMSVFSTKIIADKKRYPKLLSNGNLIDSGDLDNDKHFAQWQDPFKKPCYLFALVAGDLDVLEDQFITQSQRKVELKIYVEKGLTERAKHAMTSLKQAMRWDEEKFGREYDLDIFMIVAVSDFNMGAMENKGLNIFNSKYILADANSATDVDFEGVQIVVGHEYFHNWTGNRITCRDWFQLSLKEGLTVFRDQEFDADLNSRAITRISDVKQLRLRQFPEDASPLAHPVRPESYIAVDNFYTATVYEKGAEVIRMLQTILGVDGFRKGMDLYFERHDGQAVTCDDFVQAMADANNIDLTQFKLWYSQAGTPEVQVKTNYDTSKKTFTIDLSQKTDFFIPIKMALFDTLGIKLNAFNNQTDFVYYQKQKHEQIIVKGVETQPVLSIGRNFSAPIKLKYERPLAELYFLAEYDDDAFNRWEASQNVMHNLIQTLIAMDLDNVALELDFELIELLSAITNNQKLDKAFAACLLTLPTPTQIANRFNQHVPVDSIVKVYKYLRTQIANELHDVFLEKYHNNNTFVDYVFNASEAGRRSLKNQCLYYLANSQVQDNLELVVNQYNTANNMTDKMAALSCIVNKDVPARKTLIEDFYNEWQHDSLVMDKWLGLQANSELDDTLEQVKQLLKHPQFSYQKPNKVRALIGTFANNNFEHFHKPDGSGYQFLAEQVLLVDKINPQVAARLVTPLIEWYPHEATRQTLIRESLERILTQADLSDNVYELVKKAV